MINSNNDNINIINKNSTNMRLSMRLSMMRRIMQIDEGVSLLSGADPHRLPAFYGNRSDFS